MPATTPPRTPPKSAGANDARAAPSTAFANLRIDSLSDDSIPLKISVPAVHKPATTAAAILTNMALSHILNRLLAAPGVG
jgi:hypothetical protein